MALRGLADGVPATLARVGELVGLRAAPAGPADAEAPTRKRRGASADDAEVNLLVLAASLLSLGGDEPEDMDCGAAPAGVGAAERRRVSEAIAGLLRRCRPDAPAGALARLPALAARLEQLLLRSAEAVDDYLDVTTLDRRVRSLLARLRGPGRAGAPPGSPDACCGGSGGECCGGGKRRALFRPPPGFANPPGAPGVVGREAVLLPRASWDEDIEEARSSEESSEESEDESEEEEEPGAAVCRAVAVLAEPETDDARRAQVEALLRARAAAPGLLVAAADALALHGGGEWTAATPALLRTLAAAAAGGAASAGARERALRCALQLYAAPGLACDAHAELAAAVELLAGGGGRLLLAAVHHLLSAWPAAAGCAEEVVFANHLGRLASRAEALEPLAGPLVARVARVVGSEAAPVAAQGVAMLAHSPALRGVVAGAGPAAAAAVRDALMAAAKRHPQLAEGARGVLDGPGEGG